jgi:hypothetical protein
LKIEIKSKTNKFNFIFSLSRLTSETQLNAWKWAKTTSTWVTSQCLYLSYDDWHIQWPFSKSTNKFAPNQIIFTSQLQKVTYVSEKKILQISI